MNSEYRSNYSMRLIVLLFLGYSLLFAWARLTGWYQGDYMFFIPAARAIIDGSLDIYAHRLYPQIAPPHGLGYAYPPIFAMLLAPFVALGDFWGLSDVNIARLLMSIPLLVFDLLCVGEFLIVAKQLNRQLEAPTVAFLAVAGLTCPGFIVTSAYLNHAESLITFFAMAGYGFFVGGSIIWSGLFFAFALMTKQTALFAVLPVLLLFFRESFSRHEPKPLIAFVAAIGIPCLFIQAPFLIANPDAAYYALVKAQKQLIVGGDNLWVFVLKSIQLLLPAYGEKAQELIRVGAYMILTCANLVLMIWIVFKRRLSLTPVNLAGIIALSSFFPVVFSKWGSSVMYKILPVFFLLLWDLGRKKHSWPLVSVGVLLGYGLFDALPVGIFPSRIGDVQLVMRAFFKTALTLGIMGYLYHALIGEDPHAVKEGQRSLASPGTSKGGS